MLWQKAEPFLYISKEQFCEQLRAWTVKPVEIDCEIAFAFLTNGAEFHFESFGHHRITMAMIRESLQPLIDTYGYAATKTPHEDERQHRFNRRFGFVVTGKDEFDIHYRIERLPACPS